MRLLLIHADLIEYEVKKKTNYAEQIGEAQKHAKMEDALTAFIAVERDDADDITAISDRASDAIAEVAQQVDTYKIMLYPYAHLSSELSSPEVAIDVLKQVERSLTEFEVMRAPFGWYKSFTIKCKGHPLSELSRSIKLERKIEEIR